MQHDSETKLPIMEIHIYHNTELFFTMGNLLIDLQVSREFLKGQKKQCNGLCMTAELHGN